MKPPLISGGNAPGMHHDVVGLQASMRPPLISGGNTNERVSAAAMGVLQ